MQHMGCLLQCMLQYRHSLPRPCPPPSFSPPHPHPAAPPPPPCPLLSPSIPCSCPLFRTWQYHFFLKAQRLCSTILNQQCEFRNLANHNGLSCASMFSTALARPEEIGRA